MRTNEHTDAYLASLTDTWEHDLACNYLAGVDYCEAFWYVTPTRQTEIRNALIVASGSPTADELRKADKEDAKRLQDSHKRIMERVADLHAQGRHVAADWLEQAHRDGRVT